MHSEGKVRGFFTVKIWNGVRGLCKTLAKSCKMCAGLHILGKLNDQSCSLFGVDL